MHLSFFPTKKKLEIKTEIRDEKTFYLCNGFSYEEVQITPDKKGLKVQVIPDENVDYSKTKFEKSLNNLPVVSMEGCYMGLPNRSFPDYNGYEIINADYAFANCYNLSRLSILPDTVKTMNHCFENCEALLSHVRKIALPKELQEANHCFYNCHFTRKLKASYMPKNLSAALKMFDTVHLDFVDGLVLNDKLTSFSCSLILSDNQTIFDIVLSDNQVKIRRCNQRFYKVRKHELNQLVNLSVKEMREKSIFYKDNNLYGKFTFSSSPDAVSFIRYIFHYFNMEERKINEIEEYIQEYVSSYEGDINLLFQ